MHACMYTSRFIYPQIYRYTLVSLTLTKALEYIKTIYCKFMTKTLNILFLYKMSLSHKIKVLLVIYVHVCKLTDAGLIGIHFSSEVSFSSIQ